MYCWIVSSGARVYGLDIVHILAHYAHFSAFKVAVNA